MESPDVPWGKRDVNRVRKRMEEKPSRAAVFFFEFLQSHGVSTGRLVDLGCGAGRNAVFFVEKGFEVHAVDRSDEVLKDIELHGVMPHCHSVTDYWLFEDEFFDLAVDIFCFSEQVEKDHKSLYARELVRVLRKGGHYMISVPAAYPREDIAGHFPGFEIIASEDSEDVQRGRRFKVINLILRKL
jgi:SAM-dependent methyltransferase